jgi:hypothetical protein
MTQYMVSTCCEAYPLYELYDNGETELLGICSKCRDNATFIKEEDDEETEKSVVSL